MMMCWYRPDHSCQDETGTAISGALPVARCPLSADAENHVYLCVVQPMPETTRAIFDVLTFGGAYNTRIVLIASALLGLAAGMLGTFLLLRKRSLISDALGHAALPGVCAGFLLAMWLGGADSDARSPIWLLTGAAGGAWLGVFCVQALTTLPRVREDAAIGAVLSVFFAAGVVMLGVIQALPGGQQAGLDRLIFGQAATMREVEVWTMCAGAAVVLVACVGGFRRWRLLCFDAAFARSIGWSTARLDALLLLLTVFVTVIGLYAVGAILIVALLIIPAATARFWTERLGVMVAIAGAIGAMSGWFGAGASAVVDDLPTGPAIVTTCGAIFAASALFAPCRGWLPARLRRRRVMRSIDREHVLRALFEHGEIAGDPAAAATVTDLRRRRPWSLRGLRRVLHRAVSRGDVDRVGDAFALSDAGRAAAAEQVRRHRMWEHYMATHAGIAPSHADRGADDLEHVLSDAMVEQIEAMLMRTGRLAESGGVPRSPHGLRDPADDGPDSSAAREPADDAPEARP